MLPRFLAADLDATAGTASLNADEAHHLAHVLRLKAGDDIAVFDGAGREFRARVEHVDRHGAALTLLDALATPPEPRVSLTLAQAVLKGERMDDVVRDATMMGVAAIEPLTTERTLVRATALRHGRLVERWRRIAIASAKQCRRAVLPRIGSGMDIAEWFARHMAPCLIMLVEPSAAANARTVQELKSLPVPASATLLVGPEGGWAEMEVEAAVTAGWTPLTLGSRTLRADAMPLVAISVLQTIWGDL